MQDKYVGADSVISQAEDAVAVVPSDTTDLTSAPKGLYVGVSGDVVVIMLEAESNTTVTFKNVASGTFLPIRVRRVYATGTTATSILALY